MSIKEAIEQFFDNYEGYEHILDANEKSGKDNDPEHAEKFNLYAGLVNLSKAVEGIQSDLAKIKKKLEIV